MKLKIVLLILLLPFFSIMANAQVTTFKFTMDQIFCNSTTEAGEDEIYIILAWHLSDGQSGSFRVPNGHWNLNDGKDPRWVGSTPMWNCGLYPGASADFMVIIMEEDGGGSDQVLSTTVQYFNTIAPAATAAVPTIAPFVAAVGGVLNFIARLPLSFQDSDDFIGSFNVHVDNNNGFINCSYYNPSYSTYFGPWQNYDPNFQFRTLQAGFAHDGGNYSTRFIVHL